MTYNDLASSYDAGRFSTVSYYRVATTVASTLRDLTSTGVGYPIAFPYYGRSTEFTTFPHTAGLYHTVGQNKFLHRANVIATAGAPATLNMLDFIAFASYIDASISYEQIIPEYILPRYSSGDGVQVVLGTQVAGTGTGLIVMKYVNHKGETKSAETTINLAAGVGNLSGTNLSIYLNTQGNDGVRRVVSVWFSPGLTGMVTLALVKPIVPIPVFENNTPTEIDMFIEGGILPAIHKDAVLNFILSGTGTSASCIGYFEFIW